MKSYKKTVTGSIITFVIGTSCCWISSLAVWFGGATIIGTIASFIEDTQTLFIFVSIFLAIGSIFLYFRNRRKKLAENKVQNVHRGYAPLRRLHQPLPSIRNRRFFMNLRGSLKFRLNNTKNKKTPFF